MLIVYTEAAQRLGCAPSTIYGFIKSKQLQGCKIGRKTHVTEESVNKLLARPERIAALRAAQARTSPARAARAAGATVEIGADTESLLIERVTERVTERVLSQIGAVVKSTIVDLLGGRAE